MSRRPSRRARCSTSIPGQCAVIRGRLYSSKTSQVPTATRFELCCLGTDDSPSSASSVAALRRARERHVVVVPLLAAGDALQSARGLGHVALVAPARQRILQVCKNDHWARCVLHAVLGLAVVLFAVILSAAKYNLKRNQTLKPFERLSVLGSSLDIRRW